MLADNATPTGGRTRGAARVLFEFVCCTVCLIQSAPLHGRVQTVPLLSWHVPILRRAERDN